MHRVTWKQLVSSAFVFVIVNMILFAAYRWIFASNFSVSSLNLVDLGRLILAGVRVDSALFAIELMILGVAVLVLQQSKARPLFKVLWWLTYIHCTTAAANFFFFRERNLPLGEKLFAYLLVPKDLLVYGGGFLVINPFVTLTLIALTTGWFYAGSLSGQKLTGKELKFPLSWKGATVSLAMLLVLSSFALETYTEKRSKMGRGFRVQILNSRYHQLLSDFVLNEAVGNPLYDLFRVYGPAYFRPKYQNHLDPNEALRICQKELGTENALPSTPLLRSIEGLPESKDLDIRNVVIIQVEGLSESIMTRKENGRSVMKFLNKLASTGIYFPNIIEGFNATAGGLFTITTGFPKGVFQEKNLRFTSYEINARYATLPRILGRSAYAHLFAEGFRESYQEYIAFMSNQGFTGYDYYEIGHRLEANGKRKEADDLQGYYDGYFLEACAEIIGEVKEPNFTIHLATLTSHSPWTLPTGFISEFKEPVDQVFNYVDQSIENFVDAIKRKGKIENTIIAIIADHTSVTFNKDFMDHMRIPLILYSERMKDLGINREIKEYGSQMDVVPTILSLMPGTHCYAGFGQSLLTTALKSQKRPLYSGFSTASWLISSDWALSYTPGSEDSLLYRRQGDRLDLLDISKSNLEVTGQMEKKLLAIYETSRRLAQEQSIFPIKNCQ